LTTISGSFLIGTTSAHDEISRPENDLSSSREAMYPTPDTDGCVLDPMLAFRAVTANALGGASRRRAENTSSTVTLEDAASAGKLVKTPLRHTKRGGIRSQFAIVQLRVHLGTQWTRTGGRISLAKARVIENAKKTAHSIDERAV
jgi:hypothetical protein